MRRLAASLVGLLAFVVYLFTAYRTVPGGDSGELIGAVASGGVIHPPGYPLYALLGALFVRMPMGSGSVAFRLNVMSAVCDALAAAFLTRAVTRGARSLPAGIVAGGLFAFAPGVWRYAIAAEVFALNNLAIAVLLWLAVRYHSTRDRKLAMAGAFVLGLGLANHQTILFTGLPIVAWSVFASRGDLASPKVLARLVLAGAAGLLPYLYLPIAASHRAFVSWGAADTWPGFWTHVLRREYGTFHLAPQGVAADVHALDVFAAWWTYTFDQLGPWGVGLMAVGLFACVREVARRPRGLGLVALAPPVVAIAVMMALGNLPLTTDLYRGILARFWQQPDLYACVFAGVGFGAIVSRVPALVVRPGLQVRLASVIVLVQLAVHHRELDHHDNELVEEYGAEMLRVVPQGGVLFTKGDVITNTIRYLQLTEHVRPDVRVVDQEILATSWGPSLFEEHARGVVFPGPRLSLSPAQGFQLKQLFDANLSSPMVVCGDLTPGDHSSNASYGLWPLGFCDEVHAGSEPVSLDDWLERSEVAAPNIDFRGHAHPPGSWEAIVWSDYWEVRQARAAHIITIAGNNPARHKYLSVAADILQRIVDDNPDVPAHVHKNLALAIGRSGITTPAQKTQALRAWEGYLRVAPPDDPQLPAIHAEIERLKR